MATTTSFKVQCPSCEAGVSIKNPSLIGKKIDCPKCKYRFVVEAPADADDGEAKEKGKKASAKKPDKAKKPAKARDDADDEPPKKKKSNMILIVGLGLALLTVGVLAAAFFGGVFDDEEKPAPSANNATSANKGTTTPKSGSGSGESTPPKKEDAGPPPTPVAVGAPPLTRDPTNLLPNDAQWVLDVHAPDVLRTPAGSTLFSPDKPITGVVKEYLGAGVSDIDRVVASGGGDGAWTFTIIRTKGPINGDALKAAMDLGDPLGTIKRRDYFLVKENALFEAVGNYFASKVKDIGFQLETPQGERQLTVCPLDGKTLAVADRAIMERFLETDAQPEFRSKLTTAPAAPKGPTGGVPSTGPPGMMPPGMGSIPMMPPGMGSAPRPNADVVRPFQGSIPMMPPGGGSIPGVPPGMGPPGMMPPGMGGGTGGGTPPRVFTSIPSFRTVHPSLKAMLNAMEEPHKPIFNFAGRVKTERIMEVFFGSGIDFGFGKFKPTLPPGSKGKDAMPREPYVGITLYEFTPEKFDLRFGVECDDDEQAKELGDLVWNNFSQLIALAVSDLAGFPVGVGRRTDSDPNSNSGGYPGGPGVPPGMGFPPGMGPFPGMPPGAGGGSIPGRPPGAGSVNRADGLADVPYQGSIPGGGGSMPGMPPGMPGMPGLPGLPGMPGLPGSPGQGNQPERPKSTIDMSRADKLLVLSVNLEWKDEFPNKVRQPLQDYFDGVGGQGMMLASRYPWKKLQEAVRSFQQKGKFPRAAANRRSTANRMGLPYAPEQRISWLAELLPALGYDNLYRQLDRDQGWNTPANLRVGRAWIAEFLDPAQESSSWRAKLTSVVGRDLGGTNFVGLSGIGEDAADLPDRPEYANRLGVFGYERETPLADVTDGLDKTIFMIQVAPNIARPWIRGGGATVQGVTASNSFFPFRCMQWNKDFGAYAVMCDGSVRFIKPDIPDALFKAMVTYKAKDDTGEIDKYAPKVQVESRLKTKAVTPVGPADGPGQYVPKDWQPISVRILGAAFAVAMPPLARIDPTLEKPWEKSFAGSWKDLKFEVSARHIFGAPTADPTGAQAGDEVARFLEARGLYQEGSISDAPNLGPSKGKEFRARPNKDYKGTMVFRLWLVHGARFVLQVTAPGEPTAAEIGEFFKTGLAQGDSTVGGQGVPPAKDWQFWHNPSLKILTLFPGEPQIFPGETSIHLFWPKDTSGGGALFDFAIKDVKLDYGVDAVKTYGILEKAVKDGAFGKNPTKVTKKMLGDRAGVAFDIREGDTVYSTWAVYNNDTSAVVMKVRKDVGLPGFAEKAFFDGLQFGIDKPPKKEEPAGGPGVRPGVPPMPGVPPRPPGAGTVP